jgi:hypothetical protein
MSHQFDLFPPPVPAPERRGVNGLTLYNPWNQNIVYYELNSLGLRAKRVLGPVEYYDPAKRSRRKASK